MQVNNLNKKMNIRIGNGYDIHRLVSDRPLILGGVNIPYEKGLLGHSDADVLTHTIMDAMLGALALGDIGHYFPPTDAKWAGADSIKLLQAVDQLIKAQGWQIGNIDAVIIAEAPKLKPYIKSMCDRLAQALELEISQISVKATTNEGLDSMGQKESIAAHAVILLVRS
jgi:2-C-methyl-D-erythritol 2,4-cyclodiphosphate synthase